MVPVIFRVFPLVLENLGSDGFLARPQHLAQMKVEAEGKGRVEPSPLECCPLHLLNPPPDVESALESPMSNHCGGPGIVSAIPLVRQVGL